MVHQQLSITARTITNNIHSKQYYISMDGDEIKRIEKVNSKKQILLTKDEFSVMKFLIDREIGWYQEYKDNELLAGYVRTLRKMNRQLKDK